MRTLAFLVYLDIFPRDVTVPGMAWMILAFLIMFIIMDFKAVRK